MFKALMKNGRAALLRKRAAALVMTAVFALLTAARIPAVTANAAPVTYMPGVTDEMTDPMFWALLQEQRLGPGSSSQLLATGPSIAELNRRTMGRRAAR